MVILGIDPGYATVGYGVVRYERNQFTHIRHGAITTPAGVPLQLRLQEIYNDMLTLLDTFRPDVVAVEELFFNTNITTGIQVGHARGVILLACVQRGVELAEYTPSQVKQSVVGYGKAEKHQVMEMTRMILKLPRMPRPDDAADALALAICHAHAAGSQLARKAREPSVNIGKNNKA
ncbi:MAG: crossover junction endodeoxyribonuclease RuvC [Eubacteriales bacterium]|nr:crossover junction endodeoxyribonuclease RuvC [Eubacteriales bacterium]